MTKRLALTLVGQYGGVLKTVALDPPYAYVGVGPRLWILNISNPHQPRFVAQTAVLAGVVEAAVVQGPHLYVTIGSGGFLIFDRSNPARLREVGAYQPDGEAFDLIVDQMVAYIKVRATDAYFAQEVHIISLAAPTQPRRVGRYVLRQVDPILEDEIGAIGVAQHILYVASRWHNFFLIDVTHPEQLHEVGTFDDHTYGNGFIIQGHYLYRFAYANLSIIDVTMPAKPQAIGALQLPGSISAITLVGQSAYILAGTPTRLYTLNVANPISPTITSQLTLDRVAQQLAVSEGYAYLVSQWHGLQIVDVTRPTLPAFASSYPILGTADDVVTQDGLAYVALGDGFSADPGGVQILDITNPTQITARGFYSTSGSVIHLALDGNRLYLANRGDRIGSIHIVDVTQPTHPYSVAVYSTYTAAEGFWQPADLAVRQNTLYAIDWNYLHLLDLSDPTALHEVARYSPGWPLQKLLLAYPYAYAVGGQFSGKWGGHGEFYIIDVADPTALRTVDHYITWATGNEVAVQRKYAYYADSYAGLFVLDITNPTAITKTAYVNTPADTIAVAGDYMFTADGEGRLSVWDVTAPAQPIVIGTYPTTGHNRALKLDKNYIYMANSDGGLLIFAYTQPQQVHLPLVRR